MSRSRPLPDSTPSGNIPILSAEDTTRQKCYSCVQDYIASASAITVICGAGVSTGSGIQDFRSSDGLYSQVFTNDTGEVQLKGSGLFDMSVMHEIERFKLWGRIMLKMREKAAKAKRNNFHKWITNLYDSSRLRRCYTQNIDGLQNRGRLDMKDHVLEMHGTNAELICHKCKMSPPQPASDYAQIIEQEGLAYCPLCQEQNLQAEASNRRLRAPGYLIPRVLFNEDSAEHSCEGMSLDQMELTDGQAELLLVVGTSLRTPGAAKLVKSLARKVVKGGGVVIYIDRSPLSSRSWFKLISLHLQTDIEQWARDLTSRSQKRQISRGWSSPQSKLLSLLKLWKISSTPTEAPSQGSNSSPKGRPGTLHTSPLAEYDTAECRSQTAVMLKPENKDNKEQRMPVRLLLVVCSDGEMVPEGQEIAARVVDTCNRRGWKCRTYYHELRGCENYSLDLKNWDNYVMVVIYVSRHMQGVQLPIGEAHIEQGILRHKRRAEFLVKKLFKDAVWSTFLSICEDDELSSANAVATMANELSRVNTFKSMVLSMDLSRLRIVPWASFVTHIAEISWNHRALPLKQVVDSWMKDVDLFESTNLFCLLARRDQPIMFLASPFPARPLGRALPKIDSICPCDESEEDGEPRRWIVEHDASEGCIVRDISATAQCSRCNRTWNLPASNMLGVVRSAYGIYCIQVSGEN